ncbi:MAG: enoyl-CoA hydratase-related protein, partial [Marinobacter sp.]|nr:enoyl-CoA hydratase-related protein [Marinobacter sp.]
MTEDLLEHLNSRARYLGPDDEQALSVTRLNHWRLSRDERDIAWLVFDQQGASANVLSSEVLGELEELVRNIREQAPRAVVLRSAKKASFCMGADISEFREVTTESAVLTKLAEAHDVVDSFEGLSCPRIAVIHGQCLGGGLELALSCSYRLALPGARFGFPEVQLGLHPGLGGTVRLPRLINPVEAMKLMLTGKSVVHQKAKKLGLVDDVVEERHVLAAIESAIAGDLNKHHHGLKDQVMMSGPARQFEARQMRAESAKKAPPEHYPAPGALIDLWESHGGDTSTMAEAEMESFARLMQTDTAQNLIRVFFLREHLKGLSDADAQDICHVHVVGAGEMGGDIAGWSALKGHTVTLFDEDPEKISDAIKKLSELCERKHYSSAETREALDRLVPDFANDGAYKSDLVIEAVPEDVDIKRKVYEEVEPRMKPGAILATNTSSIPLNELARSVK